VPSEEPDAMAATDFVPRGVNWAVRGAIERDVAVRAQVGRKDGDER